MNLVASSPEGLENCLAKEIKKLGGTKIKTSKRFISFCCDKATMYRIHFYSRIAFRFFREVARFKCVDKTSLYEGVQSSFNWLKWLPVQKNFCVYVTGRSSFLPHSHFTALQVKNAIVDLQKLQLGSRSSISLNDPYLVINLHLYNDEAVISFQTTLESLHKRGYRSAMGNAPLKENVAAGLIKLTQWDNKKPLIDLMCGSGTFLLESVAMALNIPIKLQNNYLFENWLDFDKEIFLIEKEKLSKKNLSPCQNLRLIGCDIDKNVLSQARFNIENAGFADFIELKNLDSSKLIIHDQPGIILCNPPYGKKLGKGKDLIFLYEQIGQSLKRNFSGWEFWLLSGNPSLTKYLRMKASLKIPVSNGGLDCRWIKYHIR